MTTALPSADPAPVSRTAPRLRLATPAEPVEAGGTQQLTAYLVLLPADTDPAPLFADAGLRPHIQAVAIDEVPTPPPAPARVPLVRDGVLVDADQRTAAVDGAELDLTFLEFSLLAHLMERPGQVYSREQLIHHVWGYDHVGDGRTVDVHVARLRRKLGPAHRRSIVTVRRVGYKYVPRA
ncbi:winged helix-turn-helix domain-containing protein [Streptomyces tremellae]|uniref:OmpR/PhoB-type domain-containing protein n=1 Tax=Streptomyces tremellae TaxID=1124239 RepID=A0ABP7GBM8_9ACTN